MTVTEMDAATQRPNEYPVPSTMKAWVLGGPEELSLVEKKVPEPKTEAMIAINSGLSRRR